MLRDLLWSSSVHLPPMLLQTLLFTSSLSMFVDVIAQPQNYTGQHISSTYKYESHLWPTRNLQGRTNQDNVLNFDVFDKVLSEISEMLCDLGITATVFDDQSQQVYQRTVGSAYYGFDQDYGYLNHSYRYETGWTGDTPMAIYSNSKILGAVTFLASVVDTGLGYLDESLGNIFPDLLLSPEADPSTRMVTPRQLLSHTSGLARYNRGKPDEDAYYLCIYNESTTFEDCLRDHFFANGTALSAPGTMAGYNNEPFNIIAAIVVRKTGLASYGQALEQYVTRPLGMTSTSMDCSVTQSTSDKPHIAWGACSTAHDMAKLVQMLGNRGVASTTNTTILSSYSMNQLFSSATGTAANTDRLVGRGFTFSRCYGKLRDKVEQPPTSLTGYGLGTMFMSGTKGQWFTHAGSKGGYWAVAPGRFSAYFGWQDDRPYPPYTFIASLVDTLELSNSFYVSVSDSQNNETLWEESEVCGGDLYIDWLANVRGIDSIRNMSNPNYCNSTRRRMRGLGTSSMGTTSSTMTVFETSDWEREMEEVMQQL